MIEQSLMDRRHALGTEVLERLDQALPEEPFPDAVHMHPCGERIALVDDPACQRESCGGGHGIARQRVQEAGDARRHDLPRTPPVAAFEDRGGSTLAGRLLAKHRNLGHARLDPFDPFLQPRDLDPIATRRGEAGRCDLRPPISFEPRIRGRFPIRIRREDGLQGGRKMTSRHR